MIRDIQVIRRHVRRLKKPLRRIRWLFGYFFRYVVRSVSPFRDKYLLAPTNLAEIKGVFINLDHRDDRREKMLLELRKIGLLGVKRLPAVQRNPGILGAGLSHISALSGATSDQSVILVCEDDIEFVEVPEVINDVVNEFLKQPWLDVLCLAYNNREKTFPAGELLKITSHTQTSSCYLVKNWAIEPLRANFVEGVELLTKGYPARVAAVDIFWKKLQRSSLTFAIPNKPLARQVASYSDNLGRWVEPDY